MNDLGRIIGHFETHCPEGIRECFENGINPNQLYRGKPLIFELINIYLRSARFKDCIRAFVDFGLYFDDKALLAVLLDDAPRLNVLLNTDKELINKNTTSIVHLRHFAKHHCYISAPNTIMFTVPKHL
ncbi:hypothetical protein LWM68_32730 [Niabella sp. W65]|nr:hypothetical protein [Niabella sp. W65]MCH7367104.1 hypothetical protein [Niabella sp. W65]ULT42778.1 hypothetical protein KRR40_04255 [Niabella sp. I65]